MDFAYASGDDFLANMRFLIDFLNVLPTFTRSFSNRYGLPAHLQLRWFHPDDANRYFLFLRDSNLRALRNLFTGAKFIGTAPIYTNEKVAWKFMRYPGPWLVDPAEPNEDRAHSTSFDMARETDENVAALRRRVIGHDALRSGLTGGPVVGGSDRLVLETDVRGGGLGSRRLVRGRRARGEDRSAGPDPREGRLHRADADFLQRERLMMPRILDTEFSVIEVFGRAIPTVSTAVATGKLVGGSATINHALAFEPPRPVIRDWHDRLACSSATTTSRPTWTRSARCCASPPVPESQISGSNLTLRRGVEKLGPARITAPPCATRTSALAVDTVTWAAATTASSRR